MACGYVRPAELFYFVARGLAMVGVMQINQIQIHGQPVTENSVESDQYSLVSKCCEKNYTVQWPPETTNGEHMAFQIKAKWELHAEIQDDVLAVIKKMMC